MALTKPELLSALDDAREQLIDLVQQASDEDLSAPSLCTGWTNRNVLAHLVAFELNPGDAWDLVTSRRSLDDITERQSKRYDDVRTAEYVALLQRGQRRHQ